MTIGKLKLQYCPHNVRLLLYPLIIGSLLFTLGFLTLVRHVTSELLYIMAGMITFAGGCLLLIGTSVCCKPEAFFQSTVVVEFKSSHECQQQNEIGSV